ncbi:metal ABC transporter permease [Rhabdochlamydiaceae symbiont of Dictyostelium giganteum]|uniref:metal ABC transporter permease n=1 Tax=Rhabdochlamydiaceae symbiont of Dictyostelium giganteum TaxID=3342349 RepID=UPI00384A4D75
MFNIFLVFPFLISSFLAGLASSITGGIIGSYVVVKRIVFITGSIAHSVLGGMGFFLWLKRSYGWTFLDPLEGALLAAILSALLIGWIHLRYQEREDTIIAAIWSTGMALGVIFISLTPGYNVELMNFLFGNILWVSQKDLLLLGGLTAVVILIALIFHQKFQAVCFDEVESELRGIPVTFYYLLLLNLVAISVVILIQVVGSILVISMLTIPPAIANQFFHKLSAMMLGSIVCGLIFTTTGLAISFFFNLPPGATIALISAIAYTLHLIYHGLKKKSGSTSSTVTLS